MSSTRTRLSLLLLAAVSVVATANGVRVERQAFFSPPQQVLRGGPPPKPSGFSRFPSAQGFRAAPVDEDDDSINHNAVTPSQAPLLQLARVSPTPQPLLRRPADTHRDYQNPIPAVRSQQQGRRPQQPPLRNQFGQPLQDEALEEEELEEEKPDRLTLLLPQSKFNCGDKKTGYYADDGLNCEVFHYCQDNAKHSWICPEGFLFHQVHLICMPPSGDNICKQSSNYHFVNDYLYRPINQEEHLSKPNVTLRYSDRYYPDNYYEEGEERPQAPPRAAAPAPVAAIPVRGRPQTFQQPSFRPQPANQVFHSPEEVNIPLLQRRPQQPLHQAPQRSYHQGNDDDFEYDDGPFRQG